MKDIKLLRAIGAADDELLAAYENDGGLASSRSRTRKRRGLLAACLVLALAASITVPRFLFRPEEKNNDTEGCEGLWEAVYNSVDSIGDAARIYIPGYFTEQLSKSDISAIEPGKRIEWMRYSGFAGFDGSGELVEVRLDVTTTLPDSPVAVTMQRGGVARDYVLPDEPVASVHGGTEFLVYEYDTGSYILLEAECLRDGVGFLFSMQTTADFLERAKTDFEEVLDCFTYYLPGTPDLKAVVPNSIPEWRDDELTEAEARSDPDFGAYMPTKPPDGFSEESLRRFMGQGGNYLYGLWTRGFDELRWRVYYLDDNAKKRLTSTENAENYDLSLYPIPRAESVPEELREIVDNPIFYADELTMEAVNARAYTVEDFGDSDGYRMSFGVRYGDVVVEISSKGVEPEWVYEQLHDISGS